jgi:uncharacterized protein (TIGR00251 family)
MAEGDKRHGATSPVQATATGVLVRLRIQPRASVDRLEGVHGDQLRLRLTAPPVGGAANAACIAFLAKILGVSRRHVQLQAGAKSRDKLVHITGVTPAQVAKALGIIWP